MTNDPLSTAAAAAGYAFVPDEELNAFAPRRIDRPQDIRPKRQAQAEPSLIVEPAADDSWSAWLGAWSVTFRR